MSGVGCFGHQTQRRQGRRGGVKAPTREALRRGGLGRRAAGHDARRRSRRWFGRISADIDEILLRDGGARQHQSRYQKQARYGSRSHGSVPYHAPGWQNLQAPVGFESDLQVTVKQSIIHAE